MENSLRWRISYFLWQIGVRQILPRQIVNRISVDECKEKLVVVNPSHRLYVRGVVGGDVLLREGTIDRLMQASEFLPSGYSLILIEGYRALARQQTLWDEQIAAIRAESPSLSDGEVERMTRLHIAKPTISGGGHQTGGAMDVTLADAEGIELGMGTRVQEFTELTPTNTTPLATDVRKILGRAMKRAGFANYPGGWWHFSYGDRM